MYEEFDDLCDICGEYRRVLDTPDGLLCADCYAPGLSNDVASVVSFDAMDDSVKEGICSKFTLEDCL